MHTIQLDIDDSIFDKFIGLLDILPKDKIAIRSDKEELTISFKEAQQKVQRAINNVSSNKSVSLDEAIAQTLQS